MIPQNDLERAIARWKNRRDGRLESGVPEPVNSGVYDPSGDSAAVMAVDEADVEDASV